MSRRRKGGRVDAATLFAALIAIARRRLQVELWSTPFYSLALGRPRPDGLAISPKDVRPIDESVGRQILQGRMTLAGLTFEMGAGGDPWDTPSPSRAFAVDLHRFAWLPSLLAQGPQGEAEALRLTLDWVRLFGTYAPFTWGADVIDRRVFNLACGLRRLIERASDVEAATLRDTLARQARHLVRLDAGPLRLAERAAVAALVGALLSGKAGRKLSAAAVPKLSKALSVSVLPDGGLRSRSPEQGLELLFDLLTLDEALLQRGRESPQAVAHSIDRLTDAVRFFTLGDGRLAAFQGGEARSRNSIDAALTHDDGEGRTNANLPHAGYHRLAGRTLVVLVDAAAPAQGAWSLDACAQSLALEVTCGSDRLIANTGWSGDVQGMGALRRTDGGSTAVIADGSAGQPLTGLAAKGLGPRLVETPRYVEAKRHDNEAGIWLELSHDGWTALYGLKHERRLFLDQRNDELRGEDRFEPVGENLSARRAPAYAVRFHLPPEVQVSLARDKRSVLLRGPSNRGWWFRNDAPDVLLETSIYFDARLPKRGTQIVLKGLVKANTGARVRWKLTPVDPADPQAGLSPRAVSPPPPPELPR